MTTATTHPDPDFYWIEPDPESLADLLSMIATTIRYNGNTLTAIISEKTGGIIAYAIDSVSADEIVKALNLLSDHEPQP